MKKMIYIAHRGNTLGASPQDENNPNYLSSAISKGFDVEIDFRVISGNFFFGHDNPDYEVDISWIEKYKSKCWFHAKNIEGLSFINDYNDKNGEVNFFWHDKDSYTMTSKGFIWAYPGMPPGKKTIAVLPESHEIPLNQFDGICSDFIQNYK